MRLTIDNLIYRIKEFQPIKKSVLIAIDGHGGSGKSWLAQELANRDSEICIVHFDDFYCPNVNKSVDDCNLPQFDWHRLERELLIPLSENKNTKYHRYNWELDELVDWVEVNAGKIVIIEGVYSLNLNLLKYYNFKIWIDCPLEVRLTRAKARDKDFNISSMDLWLTDWIPKENNYVISQKPYNSADIIIDGSGQNSDFEPGEIQTLDSPERI
jgi:uridine kinase